MAAKSSAINEIKSEVLENMAVMLECYNQEARDDIAVITSALNYLKDDENISGDQVQEYKDHLQNLSIIMESMQTKFSNMEKLTKGVLDLFETSSAKAKKSFAEAKEAAAASMLKMNEAGKA